MKDTIPPAALLVIALLAGGSPAAAADKERKITQYVPDEDLTADSETDRQGWDGTLKLSAGLSLAQNSSVVGQADGISFTVGASAVGYAEYRDGPHEVNLKLTIIEGLSRNSALGSVVKSSDVVVLEPLYSHYMFPWLGLFVRAKAEAPLLPTEDTRPGEVTYRVARGDGSVETVENKRGRVLADALDPLTTTQSLGLVCRPIDALEGVMLVRIGAGARESLAGGTQLVADDETTPEIEVKELEDVLQVGAEMAIGVSGRIPEKRISYDVDFSALLPVINNDPRNRTAYDLFRVGLVGSLSYSLHEYLLLTYQFKVLQDPQLTEDAQVQNNVLLTFQWEVIQAAKKAPPDRKAVLEERLRAAEERERAAEERVRRAEEGEGGE